MDYADAQPVTPAEPGLEAALNTALDPIVEPMNLDLVRGLLRRDTVAAPSEFDLRQQLAQHRLWLDGVVDGRRADVRDLEIENLRLGPVRMDRAMLHRVSWPCVEACESNWTGVEAAVCTFSLGQLGGADLTGATLVRCGFDSSSLSGANLSETRLESCTFEQARAPGSRWLESAVTRCNFTGARLNQAAFHHAMLMECVFRGSELDRALFYRARLMFCRFDAAMASEMNLSFARVENTQFIDTNAVSARFASATFPGTAFERCVLSGADFRGADLRNARFHGSCLDGARFRDANLYGADLRGADLTGVKDLTSRQLGQAFTDASTMLPNGTPGPYMRNSGAERPRTYRD